MKENNGLVCEVCGVPATHRVQIFFDIEDTSFNEQIVCVCEKHNKIRQHTITSEAFYKNEEKVLYMAEK